MPVLKGQKIRLRQVREADLAAMYEFHQDIANRGEFFPTRVWSWPAWQQAYAASEFWDDPKDTGTLIIANDSDQVLGHVEFFRTVSYLDEVELGYHLYSKEHAGRGYITEAADLMAGYLFDRKKLNRIRLIIHPGNTASKRIAEKTGYTFEGLARGAWFHQGRNHDVEVWSLLRDEHYKRHASGSTSTSRSSLV